MLFYTTHTQLRVLVIEDSSDTADSLATLLTLWGHEARVAYDGMAGLREAVESEPDVILLDIGLPDVDGYVLAQLLARHPTVKRPFLVAVTGFGREADRQKARDAGIDLHLIKPVDPHQLQRLLDRLQTIIL